ncbi:MAG: hypothetical protein ACE5JD_15290 [Candidatus Methylomirabilia bacterium]
MNLPFRSLVIFVLGCTVASAFAQVAQRPGPLRPSVPGKPDEPRSVGKPHRTGELECRNCHQGKHQGILRMYLGMGGQGTPMIPSHMFQVRVACVACHIVPKEAERTARIVGQTFRPSEQACVGCHGERYRGMLQRWTDTLAKMREAVTPKLTGARGALASADPKNPKLARARKLVDDAEFNIRFVALGKGVHNVFYAADLLKLSNSWLDEAFRLLGKAPVTIDDPLVRGRYCAILCHQQAGVKVPGTVTFAKQKVPHGRHVSEFGAVCTACHSAEVHKAVTATSQTCLSCHHSPQNERCESCHRAQSAFYRGEVKTALAEIEADIMAEVVSCTACHDLSKKHSRKTIGQQCVECHDEDYLEFLNEWTVEFDKEAKEVTERLERAHAALARARRAGRKVPEAEVLVKEARQALALVRRARGVHNPVAGGELLEVARQKAEEVLKRAGSRRAE